VTEFAQALAARAYRAVLAEVLVTPSLGMSRGEMYTDSGDLRRLIGRPPVTLPRHRGRPALTRAGIAGGIGSSLPARSDENPVIVRIARDLRWATDSAPTAGRRPY